MKKLLIGLLVLGTFSVHASLDEAIQDPTQQLLKQAMRIELKKTTNQSFNCNFDSSELALTSAQTSIKSQILNIVELGSMYISVVEYLRNPTPAAQIDLGLSKAELIFRLSSDSKKIEGVNVTKYNITSTEVNTGTLLKPVIKKVESKKIVLEGACDINY